MMECTVSLAGILRPHLEKLISQYGDFLTQPAPTEAKEFTAYHNACKAVLGHLGLLMKIISVPAEQTDPDVQDLVALIQTARRETAPLIERMPEETIDDTEEEIHVEFD